MWITATKDLYNEGKCFTKDKIYSTGGIKITDKFKLKDVTIENDLGERHEIGDWWKHFELGNLNLKI
jgi:hypothetical protein